MPLNSYRQPAIEEIEPDLGKLEIQRHAMRLGVDFFLELASDLADFFDGNLTSALVFLSIARGGVQHLKDEAAACRLAEDGVLPDSLRRPVSVLGVSQFLNLPYETTRRHVARLVEQGYCERVGAQGVVMRGATMNDPRMLEVVARNEARVQALIEDLVRGGDDLVEAVSG